MDDTIINEQWHQSSLQLLKDPQNLALWQQLINDAQQQSSSKASDSQQQQLLRASFESFLKKWPLLYKYWIAYAHWEFQLGNYDAACQIYQRGLAHLEYCIEYWISYLQFKIDTITTNTMQICELFEMARSKVGSHFYSDQFYHLYLQFLDTYSHYDNDVNHFGARKLVLLRIVIELPIYHYKTFFDQFMKTLTDPTLTFKQLSSWVPQEELSSLKKQCQNNKTVIVNKLKKTFMDVYITTQFRVYQLFKFERRLSRLNFTNNPLPQQDLDNWHNYLDFVELGPFPSHHRRLIYERCLLASSQYDTFWIRYSIANLGDSRQILYRGINLAANPHHLLIKLIDLEIFAKNFTRARDLVINYIETNVNVPLPIYEKLLMVEHVLHNDDDAYIIELTNELIDETGHDWFFNIIARYNLEEKLIIQFFTRYLTSSKYIESPHYWHSLILIMIKFDKFDILKEVQLTDSTIRTIENLHYSHAVLNKVLPKSDFKTNYQNTLAKYI